MADNLFKLSSLTKSVRTVFGETTPPFTGTLVTETGAAVPLADISAFTLTLKVQDGPEDGDAVNSRTLQNILNANNVTVHATSGLVTWVIQTADLAIADATLEYYDKELHVTTFRWTLTNGRKGIHILVLEVVKIR